MIPGPGVRVPVKMKPIFELVPVSLVPYPVSRISKMKVHPAMFMKTKERKNPKWISQAQLAGKLPVIIQFPGGGVCQGERSQFSATPPCPVSRIRVPHNKYYGISREMYENKRTEKIQRCFQIGWGQCP
jgi:hypothetical protein